jgi:hypothetical protein
MNDFRGPMLYLRKERPELLVGPVKVLRADKKPGLLIAHFGANAKGVTVYLNNSLEALEGGAIDAEKAIVYGNGLEVEGAKPRVRSLGLVIVPD